MTPKRLDPHREQRLREVCDRIGHTFENLSLLNRALSHSSLGNDGIPDYERLEFLGDAVLGFLVAESLYRRKPEIPEGELTSRRSMMVSRRPLALVGEDLDLASYLQVGRGLTDDSLRSPRILADLVEAVLGAIYLDGGVRPARRFVQHFILERFKSAQEELKATTDPKTRLNQWAQSNGLGAPVYEVVDCTGPDHDPTYRVAVTLDGVTSRSDAVKSKQLGEQEAAASCFNSLMEQAREADAREEKEEEEEERRAARERSQPHPDEVEDSSLEVDDGIQLIWDEPGPEKS